VTDRQNDTVDNARGLGSPELTETLNELVRDAGGTGRVVAEQLSGSRVHRLRVETADGVRSFIVKRFSRANSAQRNQMVARRWFPAVGLADAVPDLLGIAAERSGRRVWHIYEDLGDCALAADSSGRARTRIFRSDPDRIEPAVAVIARIHARFAGHPMLAECRLYGDDFGSHFFRSAVTDAIRGLDALLALKQERAPAWTDLLHRLLAKMQELRRQQTERTEALARAGGPETLLHGDLWPINVMVSQDEGTRRARLIDWDHAGVGPVTYDLSTFLTHFPREDRQWILDRYLRCMAERGVQFPAGTNWNFLFNTAELSRLAITVAWEALSAIDHPADWAFEELELVEQWFGLLEPILPASPVTKVRS
jgi:aminoglycoside phosphotransferase